MPTGKPTLHLLCGKIAAGKSTLARRLAAAPATLLISEDHWLSTLYPGEILALDDYVRCSDRLGEAMGSHVEALLRAGLSVVLDFPANTVGRRRWMRGIFESAGTAHELHYLEVPDRVCKERLRRRNEERGHDFTTGEAGYDLITSHFVPPSPDEGFNLILHSDL